MTPELVMEVTFEEAIRQQKITRSKPFRFYRKLQRIWHHTYYILYYSRVAPDDRIHGHVVVEHRRAGKLLSVPAWWVHNLLTNGGRDFLHNQGYTNTSAGTRGAGFLAVTVDTGAPAAGDTTLTGEITTGGLARADVTTKTHTTGTNTTLLEHTYTATATHTAVQKGANFNAAAAGTMVHEFTITAASLVSNDTLKISLTITAG